MYDVADDVTVVIPHIPIRRTELGNAITSITAQTRQPSEIIVATDARREGAAATRNRALSRVTTPWVAFLDDDDTLLPHHLETLIAHARETGADVVYPGCHVVNPALGGRISLRDEWGRFGRPFDPELLRERSYIPVTSLVRTGLAQRASFGPPAGVTTDYEDWGFYVRLMDLGAMFSHVPVITWVWNHNGNNTSGRADRW